MFSFRSIRPHNGMEGIWTDLEATTCPPIVDRTVPQFHDGSLNFATGVAIKTDHQRGFMPKLAAPFIDNRGATDLKMVCSDGTELHSTAALLGKHK